MEEKRKFRRFTVDVTVHWKKIPNSEERTAQHISNVKDASLGGICLILHPGILVGDILQLKILLRGDKFIQTKGRVVWINPQSRIKGRTSLEYEGGIEFLDISDSDRKELSHFLADIFIKKSHK